MSYETQVKTGEYPIDVIHQTLHGYNAGHRLLEASTDLPSVTRRLIQIMSDLSGAGMEKALDGYLTGYPVPEIKAYAIARTWYAYEMPRPGCVWTHTFLIPFTLLNKPLNLASLTMLLKRPERGDFSEYKRVIHPEYPLTSDEWLPDIRVRALLALIYSSPISNVVVRVLDHQSWEQVVIAVWSQQWPRLRRNFTFCTGALSPRLIGEKGFDLQLTTDSSIRLFLRDKEKYLVVSDDAVEDDDHNQDLWIDTVAEDIHNRGSLTSDLRSYLNRYGIDVRPDRSAFVPLVQTYMELQRIWKSSVNRFPSSHHNSDVVEEIKEFADQISVYFPSAREARALKFALFGGTERKFIPSISVRSERWPEDSVLSAMATIDSHVSFDADLLRLTMRAQEWATKEPYPATDLLLSLIKTYISPLGEAVSAGILSAFTPELTLKLSDHAPELLPVFIQIHPSLAGDPSVWHVSASRQQEIVNVLRRHHNPDWHSVLLAMLQANATAVSKDVFQYVGSSGITTILNWIDQHDSIAIDMLSEQWKELMSQQPDAILMWLSSNPQAKATTVAVACLLLNPHDAKTLHYTDEVWCDLSQAVANNSIDHSLRTTTATYLLIIGLHNQGRCSSKIVANVFQVVHDVAAINAVPQQAWHRLESLLPSFAGIKDWDRCEKLRQSLVHNFRINSWPLDDFLKTIRDGKTFNRIIDYCKHSSDGRDFIKSIRRAARNNPELLPPFHREQSKNKGFIARIFD